MENVIATLIGSLPTLFIVAGLAFLGIAVVGNISGKIQPGTGGRILSGLIGAILIGMGLLIYKPQVSTGSVASTNVPVSDMKLTATQIIPRTIATDMVSAQVNILVPTFAPSGFQIMETFLRADPFNYVGACPVTITFSGRISVVGGGGTVSYKFLRSDGAFAPIQTLNFNGPGSQDISETWQIGASGMNYSGWEAFQVFDPQEITSDHADFKIQCQ